MMSRPASNAAIRSSACLSLSVLEQKAERVDDVVRRILIGAEVRSPEMEADEPRVIVLVDHELAWPLLRAIGSDPSKNSWAFT